MSYKPSDDSKEHIHEEYHLEIEEVRKNYGSAESVRKDLKELLKNARKVIDSFDYENPTSFYDPVWKLRAEAEFLVARITFGELGPEVKNISEKTMWKEAFNKGAKTPRNPKTLQYTFEIILDLISQAESYCEKNEWEKVYRNLWKAKELLSRALQRTVAKKKSQKNGKTPNG